MHILSMTAILTLVLNIFLAIYLCRDKINVHPYYTKNNDIVNFVLTPDDPEKVAWEEAAAETELILQSDSCNE